MRIASVSCAVLALALPVLSQTTGAPLYNDFTVNGTGSGGTSLVPTSVQGSVSMEVSGMASSAVIGAISPATAIGSIGVGTGTIDIDTNQWSFFVDGTGNFAPGNAWNAFGQTDTTGAWSIAVNGGLPPGLLGHVQYGLANAGYPGGIEVTQAHTITNISIQCLNLANPGPNMDDSTLQVLFQNGMFTFYGVAYPDLWINSNGNITFGAGDTDFTSSEAEMLANAPRLAPCWDDFSPNIAGQITYQEDAATGTVSVAWVGVPHFGAGAGDLNSFCATLELVTGNITVFWDTLDLNGGISVDQIVGISPGGNLSGANNIDLSVPFPGVNAMDAVYEDFGQAAFGVFDLFALTRMWLPAVPGGGPYSVL